MKKVFYLAFAVAAMAVSCTVEESINPSEEGVTVIGATINTLDGKTTLGDKNGSTYPVIWQEGDKINVNGIESAALTSADIEDSQKAVFTFACTIEGTYNAVSPASAYVSEGVVTIPQHQTYTEGSYDPAAGILLGTGTGSIDMTCAVAFLKFNVVCNAGVSKIQVGGLAREAIAGQFSTTDYATLSPVSGATAGFVDITCTTPVEEGSVIIAIPARTYSKGLLVMVTDASEETTSKKSTKEFVAEAGKMYSTDLILDAPAAGIVFTEDSAADAAVVSINHTKGLYDAALYLAWSADLVGATYTVSMSLAEDMSNAVVAGSGTSASLTLDNRTLNNIMAKLGKEFSEDVTVYYQVSAAGDAVVASEVRSISASTEFGSLDDPRDGEFYTVTKINGAYWMAESLRATKYSDGSDMPTGEVDLGCFFYEAGAYGKKVGAYYGFGNALRTHYNTTSTRLNNYIGDEEQIQGVCPSGWHVPNKADWMDLFTTAFALGNISLDPAFYTSATGKYGRAAFQKMVLRADVENFFGATIAESTKAGYTNDLGMYFLPAGSYERASFANGGTVAPSNYGVGVALWSESMATNSIWSSYCPFFKFGDGQYYTATTKIHWTSGAALTLRCVKDR